jgi:hypothetical protein
MTTYIVTSHRLVGYEPGDTIDEGDLNDTNIQALIDGGHISTHSVKKPAKTKITETED